MATSPEALAPAESVLIRKHLWFYTALASNRRRPTTPAQEHFVAVSNGEEAAETIHEVAFLKFRALLTAEERQAAPEPHQEQAKVKLPTHCSRCDCPLTGLRLRRQGCCEPCWWAIIREKQEAEVIRSGRELFKECRTCGTLLKDLIWRLEGTCSHCKLKEMNAALEQSRPPSSGRGSGGGRRIIRKGDPFS
jgi:hypothetical protein